MSLHYISEIRKKWTGQGAAGRVCCFSAKFVLMLFVTKSSALRYIPSSISPVPKTFKNKKGNDFLDPRDNLKLLFPVKCYRNACDACNDVSVKLLNS